MKVKPYLVILLSLISLPVYALPLQTYEIEYQTKAQGLTLKSVRKLEKTETYFQLSQTSTALMMQTNEISTFYVDNTGNFTPRSFTYERKILGNNKFQKTDFYPNKKSATYQQKGEQPKHVSTPNAIHDIFSYQEKLRLNLIASKGKTSALTFNVLERNRIREYKFKLTGSEWIHTRLGYIDTLKIERMREKTTKKTITWLAKNWGYTVVKIQHKEEGEPEYQLNIVKGIYDNREITGYKNLPVTPKPAATK